MENNPLTEQHYQQLVTGLAKLDEADQQIALAQRAGFDMTARKAEVDSTRARLLAIKQVYFPGR